MSEETNASSTPDATGTESAASTPTTNTTTPADSTAQNQKKVVKKPSIGKASSLHRFMERLDAT